jgi:hypothetical protein
MANDNELLLAERAIARQLHNYARAMDRCDEELGRAVFHSDSEVDYGTMFQGSGYGFVDFTTEAHKAMTTHMHRIGNILIQVEGRRAGSETYVEARLRLPQGEGFVDLINLGRYVDEWEQRDGVWRILRRRYLHEMDAKQVVEKADYDCAGRRDRSDASYELV